MTLFSSDLERVRSLNREIREELGGAAPMEVSPAERITHIMIRSNEIRQRLKAPGVTYEEARSLLDEGNNLWREGNRLAFDLENFPTPGDVGVVRAYREGRAQGGIFTIDLSDKRDLHEYTKIWDAPTN